MKKQNSQPNRVRTRLRLATLLATLNLCSSPLLLAQSKTSDAEGAEKAEKAEKAVQSKVVSVALFKNGLAIIKQQVSLQGAGLYRLDDVPEPVHGTFLIESNGPLEARVQARKAPAKNQSWLGSNLQDELAGLKVIIQGRSAKSPIMGTVMRSPQSEVEVASPTTSSRASFQPYNPAPSRFLLLKTEQGISYVDLGDIVSLEAVGNPQIKEPVLENRSVLLLDAKASGVGETAMISYLAHGLAWAPSYKVDLIDGSRLKIEQNAAIRNELMDLKDTEISVISGYPNVAFGQVVSPLAASQTWELFFQQLGNKSSINVFSNSVIMQNSAYNMSGNSSRSSGLAVAPNNGDTIDLHYHSIGKRALKKGDAIALSTGSAQVDYERIVEWNIPDNRDEWGSPSNTQRVDPATGQMLQDDVWDALKFKNSLPFPMTSAPAMVISAGNFSGQGQVLWTNRNEEATLRVNKALSIRARNVEYENQVGEPGQAERDLIYIGGRRFRRVTVNGELRLCNNRPTQTKMIIKRQFSGDYVKGDDTPKIDLREEGVWTVNKRNELTWTLSLKPGEERTVKYQYSVLINF